MQSKSFAFLGVYLGWQDVRDTYSRSTLGPVWITLGLAIQVAAIGTIFGLIFGVDLEIYMVFLATSLVLWTYLVSTINEATGAFVLSERIIKQMWIPVYLPVLRVVSKNTIILFHNLAVIIGVLILFRVEPTTYLVIVLPGLLVFVGNIAWASMAVGIVSARYRDLPPIVTSFLMVSFYATPILWLPDTLPEQFRTVILTFNPFYHLIEIVRAPILGSAPTLLNWSVALVGLGFGLLLAWWMSNRLGWKIAYWL